MKKINHYQVEVADPANTGIMGRDKKFEVKAFDVIGENDKYIAINDYGFTSIRKEKCDWDVCLDKPSISLRANDNVWGTRATYSLYTEKIKLASTIKKEIEAAIEKKYGFFARGLDLSFITESNATEQKGNAA
jgi:hypothetical protein